MAVLKIYVYPAPILLKTAKRVSDFGPETQEFIEDLIETMYVEDGVGLAATQVGVAKQIFVACPTMKQGEEIIVINPEIDQMQGEETDVEGCLSLPNISAKVPRAKSIRLRYYDREGTKCEMTAKDFYARVIQHETDHLNGKLFVDRVDFGTRQELLAQYEQIQKEKGRRL
ncbi:MAG: peptide deformylase [Candidatus Omnitrophica bacterium]|nr:peptide deformylase [Candidatus Omnitrophota bacterium]